MDPSLPYQITASLPKLRVQAQMIRRTFLAGLVLLFSEFHSQSALTLHIDPLTQKLWLTGSATGTTPSDGRVIWSLGNSSSLSVPTMNTNVATTSPLLTMQSIRVGSANGTPSPTFGFWFLGFNTPTTITGAGDLQKVSYAGINATAITNFEKAITMGQPIRLTQGSGFGDLLVVPEPSSASLMILGLAAVLGRSRRCWR